MKTVNRKRKSSLKNKFQQKNFYAFPECIFHALLLIKKVYLIFILLKIFSLISQVYDCLIKNDDFFTLSCLTIIFQ